jgi:hypothetical protein
MNLQRRNHFVAECYQEAFADLEGKVWVKFSDKPNPERRNPTTVGRSRSLYVRKQDGIEDDKVETFLGKEVETPFASLSLRIKNEREKLSTISGQEQIILTRFVASQAVRTLAHKRCIETQAERPVDTNTFVRVMVRQLWTMMDAWRKNPPRFHFYTSLPYVGEHFITGDSPVVVVRVNDNKVWVPTDRPTPGITQLNDILANPNYGFWVALSPYVCVALQRQDGTRTYLPPEPVEPPQVRFFNGLVRDQSKIFILARDRYSLN